MPDKSQNITINYKFNVADVKKGEETLAKANAASNALQASAQKAGNNISKGFQQGTRSILAMEQQLARLKTQISVATDPKRVAQLSNEYKKLRSELDHATKSAYGFANSQKQVGQNTATLSSQFGKLYGAAQAVFGAAILRQTVNAAINMARLSGNVEGVTRAFQSQIPVATDLLNRLRTATHGTINDLELMQRALKFQNLGGDVQRLPELLEFASIRAQQTGESIDYLVDSIVDGIGRKSLLRLDNLGISATRLKEQFNGVALSALSVGQVTEGVANIMREETQKMGGYLETSATKADRLAVSLERVWEKLSRRADTSGFLGLLTSALDGLAKAFEPAEDAQRRQIENAALIEFNSLREITLNEKRLKTNQELADAVQQEINSRVELINANNAQYDALEEKFNKLRDTHAHKHLEEMDALQLEGEAVKYKNSVYAETIKILQSYLKEITRVREEEKEDEETLGIIGRKRKEIEHLQDAIQKTNKLSDLGAGGKLTSQLEIAQAELADLLRAFTDFKIPEFKTEIDDASESLSNFDQASKRIQASLKRIADNGVSVFPPAPKSVYTPDDWQLLKDDFEANWRDITAMSIDIQASQLKSIVEADLDSYRKRLKSAEEYYQRKLEMANGDEREMARIRKKEQGALDVIRNEIARKEKRAKRSQVLIDTAAGIAKAIATYIWPYWLVPAAAAAAQGAAQLAMINRQPSSFAKGVINLKGPGTETSDSIPANLSRGESVMTAWETRVAGDVLREVRAKKLDNRELKRLREGRVAVHAGMDEQKILNGFKAAVKEIQFPDVVEQGHIVYKSQKYGDAYRKKVRASSMGL